MSATPYGAGAPARSLPTGLAVASLVFGIIGVLSSFFLVGGLFGLIAVILGIVALGKIKRGEAGGRGLAIGGIVSGAIAMALALIIALVVGNFLADNAENFSNLGECLEQADSPAAERACEDEFERNVNP